MPTSLVALRNDNVDTRFYLPLRLLGGTDKRSERNATLVNLLDNRRGSYAQGADDKFDRMIESLVQKRLAVAGA